MVSIIDIARLANTSKSTVSRVLNGQAYVKPAIRERVQAIVKETGYVPNQAARNMVMQRTHTIGIVLPDTFNVFQRQLFASIQHHLEQSGYHLDLFFEQVSATDEPTFLRRLKSEKIDGIIVAHEVVSPAFYDYLDASGIPTVLCTFDRAGSHFHSVKTDADQGAFDAVEYLIGLGHRNIGIIRGRFSTFSRQRFEGFSRAMAKHALSRNVAMEEIVPDYSMEAGKQGMDQILARKTAITAVFAFSDELAIGAMRSLYEQGILVPADISIIGFDDIDLTGFLGPGLTTIHQPIEDMGKVTADTLRELIDGISPAMRQIILPHQIVKRESCRSLLGLPVSGSGQAVV